MNLDNVFINLNNGSADNDNLYLNIEINKDDEEVIKELKKDMGSDLVEISNKSFLGNEIIQYILPITSVFIPVLLKYLENKKIKIKFDGIEIEGNKKEIGEILAKIEEYKKRNDKND